MSLQLILLFQAIFHSAIAAILRYLQTVMGLLYLAIQSLLSTVIYCNFSCISQHLEEPFESSVLQWHQYAHCVYLLPISEWQEKEKWVIKEWNIFPIKASILHASVDFGHYLLSDWAGCSVFVSLCYSFPLPTPQHTGSGLGN